MIPSTEASKLECIAISWSATLGSEAIQLECIAISRSATLGTKESAAVHRDWSLIDTRSRGQSAGVYSD